MERGIILGFLADRIMSHFTAFRCCASASHGRSHAGSIREIISLNPEKANEGRSKTPRVIAKGMRELSHSGTVAYALCILPLSLLMQACTEPSAHEPVTLTLLEEWTQMTFSQGRHDELEQFTRETGIRVKLLPSPESAREKLALWQDLLRTGVRDPDVYGIDVIWPRIL
ncbi:MAG: hypothetical protein JWO80_5219, partial [Bryobacterales bacterium]|nr:hypothetical protein [Bryobacterales bacterium]